MDFELHRHHHLRLLLLLLNHSAHFNWTCRLDKDLFPQQASDSERKGAFGAAADGLKEAAVLVRANWGVEYHVDIATLLAAVLPLKLAQSIPLPPPPPSSTLPLPFPPPSPPPPW